MERSSPQGALGVRESAELHYKQWSPFSEDRKRNKIKKKKKSTACCYQEPLKKGERLRLRTIASGMQNPYPQRASKKMSSLLNKNVIENKRKLISLGKKALQDVLVKQKREKNAESAVFY